MRKNFDDLDWDEVLSKPVNKFCPLCDCDMLRDDLDWNTECKCICHAVGRGRIQN